MQNILRKGVTKSLLSSNNARTILAAQ
jgi:chaperonin GroEL